MTRAAAGPIRRSGASSFRGPDRPERGVNDAGITGGDGRWGYETFMSRIDWLHSNGKGVIFDSSASGDGAREYGLASYLLVSNGTDGLGSGPGSSPDDWWKGYDVRLGAPKGPRHSSSGLLRRDFEHGFVLVNKPGGSTRTVDLPAGATGPAGAARSSATLSGGQGAVIVTGTPGAGPAADEDGDRGAAHSPSRGALAGARRASPGAAQAPLPRAVLVRGACAPRTGRPRSHTAAAQNRARMGPGPRRSGCHAAWTLPQAVPPPAGRPVPSARGVPRLGAGHRLLLSPAPLPHPAALLGRNGADPQESPRVRVLITGGAGYIGLLASERLLAAGRDVTVLDSLLHGQVELAERLEGAGARVLRGDVRDSAARADALVDVEAVVHLAAIVGDPACARDPELSQAVNVEGSKTLAAEAGEVGVERFIFASTCSNYGRMSRPCGSCRRERAARPGVALRRAEGERRAVAARIASTVPSPRPAFDSRPSTARRRGCAST